MCSTYTRQQCRLVYICCCTKYVIEMITGTEQVLRGVSAMPYIYTKCTESTQQQYTGNSTVSQQFDGTTTALLNYSSTYCDVYGSGYWYTSVYVHLVLSVYVRTQDEYGYSSMWIVLLFVNRYQYLCTLAVGGARRRCDALVWVTGVIRPMGYQVVSYLVRVVHKIQVNRSF